MRCSLRSRTGAMTATRTKLRALLATTAATGLALTGFAVASASPASAGSDPCASPMYKIVVDDQGFSTGNNDKIAIFVNDTSEYPNVISKVMWNPAQTVMICRADGVDKNGTTYVDTNPKGNRHTADAATGIRSLTVTATDIPASQPDPCASPMYRLHIDDQGAFTGNSDEIGVLTNKPRPTTPGVGTLWGANGSRASSIEMCSATFHNLDGTVHEDDTRYSGSASGSYDSPSGYSGADFTATNIPTATPTPAPTPSRTSAPASSSPSPTIAAPASKFVAAKVTADSTRVRRTGRIGVTSRNLRPGRAVKVFEERVAGGRRVSTKKGQATVNQYGTTRFSFTPDNVAGKAKIVVIGADASGNSVRVAFAVTVT